MPQICVPQIDFYTTKDDINLRTNCSNNNYGQLGNQDLHSPLREGDKGHSTCKLDDVDPDMLFCDGRFTMQDYKPRHYGFSLGYDCTFLDRSSLRGLSFNVTISDQTNKTTCSKIPASYGGFLNCERLYT